MKSKIKINDIFAYIIGNYRYWCYENYRFLLRKHITEQFEWRITIMNKECYSSGSCIKCGCDTPALQMASKACEGGCYFEMLDSSTWNKVKRTSLFEIKIKPPILTVAECFPKKEEDEEYEWPIMSKGYIYEEGVPVRGLNFPVPDKISPLDYDKHLEFKKK